MAAADRPTHRRPTINDVATASGVSRGTVSRVLTGEGYVSKESRAAVLKAVRTTGYVANRHARGLATQRSQTVAFILSEPQHRLFEDPNFGLLFRECTRALAAHDVMLVLTVAGDESDRKRVSRFVAEGGVDGALLVSTHAGSPLLDELLGVDVPLVLSGKPTSLEHDVAYVAADDREGSRRMVRHLRSAGRERIVTITGPMDTSGGVDRLAGYRDVVGEPDPRWIAEGDYTREGGRRAMTALLADRPDLDAVFVASDLMAAGALDALESAGRRVPEDVAVGGFDDSSVAAHCRPPLTTIQQPWARISREMVRLLMGMIEGESPAGMLLPTRLVERDSV
ncbi:LacI family DNA-binding transcriptional regulator [Nocardiopsis synnemataformans]|uniref:LacI family DNA-binding transcriptional regulator n=1 Tax=Nocardiopsis synnemataformans TaxID=61305 RepID=UPI003EBF9438